MYEDRMSFIESMNNFISTSKATLNNILEELNWTKDSIYSALQHQQAQPPGKDSTTGNDLPTDRGESASEAEGFNTVSVAPEATYDELLASLSQAQSTSKQDDKKSREEVLLEMLKLERDAKRRRTNYKNRVHTKNKSHLEIMRDVLAEQMTTYFGGTESDQTALKEKNSENKKAGIIEVKFPGGNPHLLWKSLLEEENKSSKKKDRNNKNHRDDIPEDRLAHPGSSKIRSSHRDGKYSDERCRDSYKNYSKHKYSEYDLHPNRGDRYKGTRDRTERYDDRYHKKSKYSKEYREDRSPDRENVHRRSRDEDSLSKTEAQDSDDDFRKKSHKKSKSSKEYRDDRVNVHHRSRDEDSLSKDEADDEFRKEKSHKKSKSSKEYREDRENVHYKSRDEDSLSKAEADEFRKEKSHKKKKKRERRSTSSSPDRRKSKKHKSRHKSP